MNDTDIIVTSLEQWLGFGQSSPNGRMIAAIFSLVNYYNSARNTMVLVDKQHNHGD
jgi:hypothetical protein